MENLKNNKKLMMVFRILLIVTAFVAIMDFIDVMKFTINESDWDDDEICENFKSMVKLYNFVTFSSVVLLVLSVFSSAFASRVSNVFRTITLAVCTIMNFAAFHSNKVINWYCKLYDEDGDYKDAGLTKSQYREAWNLDTDDVMGYLATIMLLALIFLILAITSIHWLAKQKEPKQPEAIDTNV